MTSSPQGEDYVMLLPENYITQQDSAQQPSPSGEGGGFSRRMRGSPHGDGQVPSNFIVNNRPFRIISLFLIDNNEGGRRTATIGVKSNANAYI